MTEFISYVAKNTEEQLFLFTPPRQLTEPVLKEWYVAH